MDANALLNIFERSVKQHGLRNLGFLGDHFKEIVTARPTNS